MTIEWKPGDVATSRYGAAMVVKYHRAGCKDLHKNYPLHVHFANGDWGTTTELRPLVVIDPEDREQVERLRASLEGMSFSPWACGAATCLTTALREFANPTPPKPDEPTGLGAVVEDAKGQRWVRDEAKEANEANETRPWYRRGVGVCRYYSEIDAVRVLSEGVHL